MIEVSGIRYGCSWDADRQVMAMPLRIEFGTRGPEVTVDEMLEGRGHTYMEVDQLMNLVEDMYPSGPIELVEYPPASVVCELMGRGYFVSILG
jgi:hypothetical protein